MVWERSDRRGDIVVPLSSQPRAAHSPDRGVAAAPRRRRARRRLVASLAALAVVVPGALSPATADSLVGPGDFTDGPGAWFAYGPGVTSGVEDGQFCATVPGGTANPWDAAVQLDGVDIEAGATHSFRFTASSTVETGIVVQVGPGWPDVFQAFPTIGTEASEHAFTFTPEWSADG